MYEQRIISRLTKLLLCLAFVLALVLLPPSSAHAVTGLHAADSNEQLAAATSPLTNLSHGHAHGTALQADCSSDSGKTEHETGGQQCCAGICLTAILVEDSGALPKEASTINHAALHSVFVAASGSGLLRPPKHLT